MQRHRGLEHITSSNISRATAIVTQASTAALRPEAVEAGVEHMRVEAPVHVPSLAEAAAGARVAAAARLG